MVSILTAADYSRNLTEEIRRLLIEHKLAVRGKRVLLKPNLVEFDPGTVICTHPAVIAAALESFRALGAAEVRIGEGPGHRRDAFEIAEAAGYPKMIPDFESLFLDLNYEDVVAIPVRGARRGLKKLYLAQAAVQYDLIVSLPKMKTHHWVGVTLGMKNLFGLVSGSVYGWPKNILHWSGIHECVAALHDALPHCFSIVDGIIGMEGNGPIQGTPKAANVIVMGRDMVAVDATCCRVMGLDPHKVHYLQMAQTQNQLLETEVQQIGEPIRKVQCPFEMVKHLRPLRL